MIHATQLGEMLIGLLGEFLLCGLFDLYHADKQMHDVLDDGSSLVQLSLILEKVK